MTQQSQPESQQQEPQPESFTTGWNEDQLRYFRDSADQRHREHCGTSCTEPSHVLKHADLDIAHPNEKPHKSGYKPDVLLVGLRKPERPATDVQRRLVANSGCGLDHAKQVEEHYKTTYSPEPPQPSQHQRIQAALKKRGYTSISQVRIGREWAEFEEEAGL